MQDYREVLETDTVRGAREIWNNNLMVLMSNFSGTAFPTENLVVGMKCYRTDEQKTYTLKSLDPLTWEKDGTGDAAEDTAETVRSATLYVKTLMPSLSDRAADWSALFGGCRALEAIDLRVLGYGAEVTNISFLFSNCNSLISILALEQKAFNISKPNFVTAADGTVTDSRAANKAAATVILAAGLFQNCESLPAVNAENLNVARVQVFRDMFKNCRKLTTLDVSQWDVGEATSMQQMFAGCQSLAQLDVTRWDVSKVQDFTRMFAGCENLAILGMLTHNYGGMAIGKGGQLADWNTASATGVAELFQNCASLAYLDLTNWDMRNVKNASGMFQNCRALHQVKRGTNTFNMPACTKMRYMFAGSDVHFVSQYKDHLLDAGASFSMTCPAAEDMSHMFEGFTGANFKRECRHESAIDTICLLSHAPESETMPDSYAVTHCGFTLSLATPALRFTNDMFQGCPLDLLDVQLDTAKVFDMAGMFLGAGCKSIRLRNFDTTSVAKQKGSNGMDGLFEECRHLQYLILDGTAFRFKLLYDVLADLPAACRILVPAALLAEYQAADYWKDHADMLETIEAYNLDGAVVVSKK